jgi:hypothetical protein
MNDALVWEEAGWGLRASDQLCTYLIQDFGVSFCMKGICGWMQPIPHHFSSEDVAKEWCRSYHAAIKSEIDKKTWNTVGLLEENERLKAALNAITARPMPYQDQVRIMRLMVEEALASPVVGKQPDKIPQDAKTYRSEYADGEHNSIMEIMATKDGLEINEIVTVPWDWIMKMAEERETHA